MLIKCPECRGDVSDTAPACPACGYVLKSPAPPVLAQPQGLTTQQQILIEQRITNEGPNAGIAYVLWFFTGVLGGHRFYVNRTGSAVAMLVLFCSLIGWPIVWIWWVIDAFLIPSMLQEKRSRLRQALTNVAGGSTPENPYKALSSYHDPNATQPGSIVS